MTPALWKALWCLLAGVYVGGGVVFLVRLRRMLLELAAESAAESQQNAVAQMQMLEWWRQHAVVRVLAYAVLGVVSLLWPLTLAAASRRVGSRSRRARSRGFTTTAALCLVGLALAAVIFVALLADVQAGVDPERARRAILSAGLVEPKLEPNRWSGGCPEGEARFDGEATAASGAHVPVIVCCNVSVWNEAARSCSVRFR